MKIQTSINDGLEIIPENGFERAIIGAIFGAIKYGVRINLEPNDDPQSRTRPNPALVGTEFDYEPVRDAYRGEHVDDDGDFEDFDEADKREAAVA